MSVSKWSNLNYNIMNGKRLEKKRGKRVEKPKQQRKNKTSKTIRNLCVQRISIKSVYWSRG